MVWANLSLIKYLIQYCSFISANDQQVKHGGPGKRQAREGLRRCCAACDGGFGSSRAPCQGSHGMDGHCWAGPVSHLSKILLLHSGRKPLIPWSPLPGLGCKNTSDAQWWGCSMSPSAPVLLEGLVGLQYSHCAPATSWVFLY